MIYFFQNKEMSQIYSAGECERFWGIWIEKQTYKHSSTEKLPVPGMSIYRNTCLIFYSTVEYW